MSSGDQVTQTEVRRLRRQVKEFLQLFDDLLNSIIPEMLDAAHVQAGGVDLMIDPIVMRAVAEVIRQLGTLPGNPPTIPLVPLSHAAL